MKKIFSIFILFLILVETSLIVISVFFDFKTDSEPEELYFLEGDQSWADTLLSHMDMDEKIGQIFFIELNDAKTISPITDSLILNSSIGGLKFKNTKLINQLILTNRIQSNAKYPFLIGSEGSLVNQDDFNFPIGPVINTSNDSSFTESYLKNYVEILKLEGVGIDFSNSLNLVDSTNPEGGFSELFHQVSRQSSFFRKHLQNNKIISCINFNDNRFYKASLAKNDSIIQKEKDLNIEKFFAIQQSPEIIKKIIDQENQMSYSDFMRKQHKFNGLIICNLPDSLNEQSIERLFKSGTDIFITSENHDKFFLQIKNLIEQKQISEQELNYKVKRILMAKKWAGLDKQAFHSAELSASKIYDQNKKNISWQLYEKSICLVKNQGNNIPLAKLINRETLILTVGQQPFNQLAQCLNFYTDAGKSAYENIDKLKKDIAPYRNIIVAVDKAINENTNDSLLLTFLKKSSKLKKIIVANFGNPINIKKLLFAQTVIQAYDSHPFSQIITAQVIAGAISPKGNLIPKFSRLSKKTTYTGLDRLQYIIPEAAGFNSTKLSLIDSLIQESIHIGATPGCQILAAKNGKVFYYKSFGYHQYDGKQKVNNLDVYDLASITKVAATTMVAMKLYEKGKIRLEDSIKYYVEDTIHCTIKNHQLRDFFIHQSGLQPDMPILQYIRYRKKGIGRFDKYYSPKNDSSYTLKVAKDFYLRKDYLDSIKFSLYNLKWDSTKKYQYSDINFNIIFDVILRKINEDYVSYLNSNIYNPLQLRSIGFLPIDRLPEERIAPTQDDKFWRKQLLIGVPHDESAAIYGGISGNAGLFSNANDLAVLFQMLLNGGTYGGKKIFDKETIDYFTSKQDNSSRGLGFAWNNGFYGHTGFTGCVVWANPENKMIFVFLSNSVYPKPANQKMKQMKIRSKVLNLILSAYNPEKLNQINED